MELLRHHRRVPSRISRHASSRFTDDDVFRQFPEMRRENPQLQRLHVRLMETGGRRVLQRDRGFLFIYNATSGEMVPSCDRHFTLRNAQVKKRQKYKEAKNDRFLFLKEKNEYF